MGPEDALFSELCLQALGPRAISPLQLWAMLFPCPLCSMPSHWGSSVFSMNSSSKASGFYVFIAFPTICAPSFVIFDTCHTIHISLVPFPPRGSSLGPQVMWERAVEHKAEPHLQLKMRDGQSMKWYQSDQTKLPPLLPSRKLQLLGNRCYRDDLSISFDNGYLYL